MINEIIKDLVKLKIENAPMYLDDDFEQGYKQAMNDVEQIIQKYGIDEKMNATYLLSNWNSPYGVFNSKEKLFEYAQAYSKKYTISKDHWSYNKIDYNPSREEFDKPFKCDFGGEDEYGTHYFNV